jgi:hypothetical protein
LRETQVEEEPDVPGPEAALLLDQAEGIVNAVAPDALDEARAREGRSGRRNANGGKRKRFFRRD